MYGIQSSLYTVAVALCVFSTGILREKQSRTGRPFAWFTSFLFVATLGFAFELLMIHPAVPLKALWLGLRMGTSLLIAPCLWLAVKESVEGVRPRMADLGRGHWAAIGAGFTLLIPLIGSTHFGVDYSKPPGPVRPLHFAIHETMLLCIGIFAVQVPVYLWRCRQLLRASSGSQAWLQFPLAVVFTMWVLGLLRTVQCATHAPKELTLLFALTEVGVSVGAMYSIIRRVSVPAPSETAGENESTRAVEIAPDPIPAPAMATAVPLLVSAETIASTVPLVPGPISVPQPIILQETLILPAGDQAEPPKTKYARSTLDAATRRRIKHKLEAALAMESVCNDSLLNLRSLSRSINEKAHYVSQVINQDLNTSFYEFVSLHRIERAKQILVHAPDQTVLEIALAVGFNSKSTFNTAFRRHTGVTPREYRAKRGGSF